MKKDGIFLITLGCLLTITLICFIVGFYCLMIELEDEVALFFLSLSGVPVFVCIGIVIGFLIKGEKE